MLTANIASYLSQICFPDEWQKPYILDAIDSVSSLFEKWLQFLSKAFKGYFNIGEKKN